MLTVRELVIAMRAGDAEEINLGIGSGLVGFNHRNDAELEAWGDYVVNRIYATGEGKYELYIATRMEKVGDAK